ncbi:MAG: Xaa-Pro aminopeptidase [Thaumarchaeota archaeon]|nr:Xaa-Pro aminopeptidase [Nitrososphaerota archaeon]|tara:strand:+ start:3325 stop:4380 length:1056 start_codon:yes stop_codon:yes gene_type:complete
MDRSKVLLKEAAKIKCNSLIAFEPENVFYTTGFWGEAVAIINKDGVKLITPKLEIERAKKDSEKCEVIPTERGSNMIEILLSNLTNDTTCTDCNDITTFKVIEKKTELIYSTEVFYHSRKIKDDNEIKIVAHTANILDKLFALCEKIIRVNVTEKYLQATLLYEAMKMGAYPPSYKYTLSPLIVASGINSTLPHAEPTNRNIRNGDVITVDLTLRHKGYVADATRTFAIGRISSEIRKIYGVVEEAQEAGLDAVKTGAICGEVDNTCRSLIERKGYGKYFIHSAGHGIGLEVHERPWIRTKNKEVLEKNMIITIEPGVYIPNKFGVRIEDSIVVGEKTKNLNRYTKKMIIL